MRLFVSAAILILLSGCSLFKPYKLDIPQGNLVTQEMLAKIEVGMSKEQVKFILGSPVTSNAFEPDRWIYFYQNTDNGDIVLQQTISLIFKESELSEIEGEAQLSDADIQKP